MSTGNIKVFLFPECILLENAAKANYNSLIRITLWHCNPSLTLLNLFFFLENLETMLLEFVTIQCGVPLKIVCEYR